MRLFPNALLMLALSAIIASCKKDSEGDGLTCADLTDRKEFCVQNFRCQL